MSDGVAEQVRAYVEQYLNRMRYDTRFQGLFDLLQRYPATMAVWFSRLAGEAYDANNFWANFACKLGFQHFNQPQREKLAARFRTVCQVRMSAFVEPEVGAWSHAGQFLFQAAIPLCHCDVFAVAMRAVAGDIGLPDPEREEELEEFSADLILRLHGLLKRALGAASGLYLLREAVRVIREEDYSAINPTLAERLCSRFAQAGFGHGAASPRSPYLRLTESCTSLELVGPVQPQEVIGGAGLSWWVDGQPHRVGSRDEFTFPIYQQASLSVELRGLRGNRSLRREFQLNLHALQPPFFVFSATDRRQKRIQADTGVCALPCGDYWIVHRASDAFDGAETVLPWTASSMMTTLLKVRPGVSIALRNGDEAVICEFRPSVTPFLEDNSPSLLTDDGERVHYGWRALPTVWIPKQDADAGWTLRANLNGVEREWTLHPEIGSALGELVACRADAGDFLDSLAPALYEVRFGVIRRTRRQISQSLFFWHRLKLARDAEFQFEARPQNLTWDDCRGFDLNQGCCRHRHDGQRQHRLAFTLQDGVVKCLHWSQPGRFVESFDAEAGVSRSFHSHPLGTVLAAMVESRQWLRIWRVPHEKWALEIMGPGCSPDRRSFDRPWIDVSLADLATRFPRGGELRLCYRDLSETVARFACPLVPTAASVSDTGTHRTLALSFAEAVSQIRIRIRDLCSDRHQDLELAEFAQDAESHLAIAGLGTIEVRRTCSDWQEWREGLEQLEHRIADQELKTHEIAQPQHGIVLRVSKSGWEPGLWNCELWSRRSEGEEWQPVASQRGEVVALLNPVSGAAQLEEPVAALVWVVWTSHQQAVPVIVPQANWHEHRESLLRALSNALEWRSRSFHPGVAVQFDWVNALCDELSRVADALTQSDGAPSFVPRLIQLAASESGHDLFAQMPSLLALPARNYGGLDGSTPVLEALAWCNRLALRATVAEALRDDCVSIDTSALACFSNFAQVATGQRGHTDLRRFRLPNFFDQVIEPMTEYDETPESVGQTVLGRDHARYAYQRFRSDSQRTEMPGAAFALINQSQGLQQWLRSELNDEARVVPANAWHQPWLRVNSRVACHEMVPQFISVFCLAARAAAAGWLDFDATMHWLQGHAFNASAVREAIASIVRVAPELVGFHLMFWELMIRTYPHD